MIEWKDLLSVPYIAGGRDPHVGLDCWGLLLELYHRAGVELPDYSGEIGEAAVERLWHDEIEERWVKVPAPEQELDMFLFGLWRQPRHVGVAIAPLKVLHTADKKLSPVVQDYSRLAPLAFGTFRHTQLASSV